mmetsp:Transcript_4674/g.11177  ORF Transcript_4674/g.11177 Transcript_4674/m.11177 type:complete len:265 (-) Transcript_4674:107-901(-)
MHRGLQRFLHHLGLALRSCRRRCGGLQLALQVGSQRPRIRSCLLGCRHVRQLGVQGLRGVRHLLDRLTQSLHFALRGLAQVLQPLQRILCSYVSFRFALQLGRQLLRVAPRSGKLLCQHGTALLGHFAARSLNAALGFDGQVLSHLPQRLLQLRAPRSEGLLVLAQVQQRLPQSGSLQVQLLLLFLQLLARLVNGLLDCAAQQRLRDLRQDHLLGPHVRLKLLHLRLAPGPLLLHLPQNLVENEALLGSMSAIPVGPRLRTQRA